MEEYRLDYIRVLEAEAIHVLREVAAQFENPVILFSGGKDSIVVTHLAIKAFYPSNCPFPLLHIDTGHNFPETLRFRDQLVKDNGLRLIVGSVQKSIDEGKVVDQGEGGAYRNRLQTTTLLDTIEEFQIDACVGGARRDEEKARAKERFFSHRDEFGQWDPKNQRAELWSLYNGHLNPLEHFRVFPLNNWTELDVWQYIKLEGIQIPEIYFSHNRKCFRRGKTLISLSEHIEISPDTDILNLNVRFRTLGDITITGAVESTAGTVDEIIDELIQTRTSERGERADDKVSSTSMEDRKKEGYF